MLEKFGVSKHAIKLFLLLFVLLHRQNVVIVGAGRTSRSATSSELLYLLNLLYNMRSECCDEYKLIQLYQKSSVWCFAFSHTSTFELIPAVATALPGALVTRCRTEGTRDETHGRVQLYIDPTCVSRARPDWGAVLCC